MPPNQPGSAEQNPPRKERRRVLGNPSLCVSAASVALPWGCRVPQRPAESLSSGMWCARGRQARRGDALKLEACCVIRQALRFEPSLYVASTETPTFAGAWTLAKSRCHLVGVFKQRFCSSGDSLGRYFLNVACLFVTARWCVLGAVGVVLANSYLLAQQGCYGDPLRHSNNFLK